MSALDRIGRLLREALGALLLFVYALAVFVTMRAAARLYGHWPTTLFVVLAAIVAALLAAVAP